MPDKTPDNLDDLNDFDDNIEATLPRYGEGWLLESYGEIIPANVEAQKSIKNYLNTIYRKSNRACNETPGYVIEPIKIF